MLVCFIIFILLFLHFSVAADRNKVPICNFKILYDSRVCSNFAKKIRVVFFSHYRPKSTRDGSSDGNRSSSPIDVCNIRGVTDAQPALNEGISSFLEDLSPGWICSETPLW